MGEHLHLFVHALAVGQRALMRLAVAVDLIKPARNRRTGFQHLGGPVHQQHLGAAPFQGQAGLAATGRRATGTLPDPLSFQLLNEVGIIGQLSGNLAGRLLAPALNLSQFTVLNHFARLGGERPLVQLAGAMQVTKAAMTNTVARLQAKGLLQVRPDPADGRSKLVSLTAEGLAARQAAVARLGQGLAPLQGVVDTPATDRRAGRAAPAAAVVRPEPLAHRQVPGRDLTAKALGQEVDQQTQRQRLVLPRQDHRVDAQCLGRMPRQHLHQRAAAQFIADEVGRSIAMPAPAMAACLSTAVSLPDRLPRTAWLTRRSDGPSR